MFQAPLRADDRRRQKGRRATGTRRAMRENLTQAPMAGLGQGTVPSSTPYGMLDHVTNDRRNQTYGRTY